MVYGRASVQLRLALVSKLEDATTAIDGARPGLYACASVQLWLASVRELASTLVTIDAARGRCSRSSTRLYDR